MIRYLNKKINNYIFLLMKTLKILAVSTMFFLSINSLSAQNPSSSSVDSISTPMVQYLDNDVNLTSQQKLSIRQGANEYALNLLNARNLSNAEESYNLMKSSTEKYQAIVESVLTNEQKSLRLQKQNERLIEINRIANSNN